MKLNYTATYKLEFENSDHDSFWLPSMAKEQTQHTFQAQSIRRPRYSRYQRINANALPILREDLQDNREYTNCQELISQLFYSVSPTKPILENAYLSIRPCGRSKYAILLWGTKHRISNMPTFIHMAAEEA
jgi:hypothetical protein